MILPSVLILGAHLVMPVADSVPTLNVEQVCQGIAQQGGVSFHDTDIADEKKNCLDSEKAIRDELAKEWSSFSPADKTACTNESKYGRRIRAIPNCSPAWKWRATCGQCAASRRSRPLRRSPLRRVTHRRSHSALRHNIVLVVARRALR